MRQLLALVLAAAGLAATPALASAAPPVNDAYLASLPVDARAEFTATDGHDRGDDAGRPVQPERDGAAARRRRPGAADLQGHPVRQDGLVRPRAAGRRRRRDPRDGLRHGRGGVRVGRGRRRGSPGRSTARPTRPPRTSSSSVRAKRRYTIQVGGAGGVGGPLNLKVDYFPDTRPRRRATTRSTSARQSPGSSASAAARRS